MPEWSTYSLSDFLMFAPRTYYRLLELYNRALWPAHLAALAGGLVVVALSARSGALARRVQHAMLAAAWAWVAWAWLQQRYATINWAAGHFAIAFGVQAVLLVVAAVLPRSQDRDAPRGRVGAGAALALAAVIGYPLIGLAEGRGLASAEVFGLAPDPTAIATLGLLAPSRHVTGIVVLAIPLAWCAIAAATLWTMGTPSWWVPLLAAVATIAIVAAPVRVSAHR